MKAIVFLATCMLIATLAIAQDETKFKQNESQAQDDFLTELLKTYLKENVCYPERAIQCKREGTELAQFTITAEGKITDIKIINSVCPVIDAEIITALENYDGMLLPAYKNGEPNNRLKEISLAFCCTNESSKPLNVLFKERGIEYFGRAGKALFEKHDVEKALNLYSRAINYLPRDKSLRLMRGMCRYELGDTEGANTDWDRMAISGDDPIDMGTYMNQLQGFKGYNELMVKLNQ